jgi:LysR family glycine cleavage system transcriptional activator
MADLPPLDALRVFDAAARAQSFAKAAEALHLTPSAVSHRIKALEDLLGARLFERRVRAVRLTAAGQGYAGAVAGALDLLREATRRLRPGEANRALTVSTTQLFAVRWLVPRLARFEAANPETVVHLNVTTSLANFAGDGVDLAIRTGAGAWPGLAAHHLMPFDMHPVAAPALLEGRRPLAAPADLAQHTLLHSDSYPEAWHVWLHAAGVAGVDAARGRHFTDTATAIEAAIAGLGVAITQPPFVAAELAEGRLAVPFARAVPSGRAYFLVYPEARAGDPKIAAFRDWILGEFAAAARKPPRRGKAASTIRRRGGR